MIKFDEHPAAACTDHCLVGGRRFAGIIQESARRLTTERVPSGTLEGAGRRPCIRSVAPSGTWPFSGRPHPGGRSRPSAQGRPSSEGAFPRSERGEDGVGSPGRADGHDAKDQAFRDLPSLGKASSIVVKRKRYRCRNCGATFLLPLKEMDERRQMTARLVDGIKRESIKRTFASIAAEAGVDEKTVRNLFHEYTDELAKQYNPLKPKWLGLDEIHLIRKPRAIITNLETRTVVEMLKDREKATLEAYFATWGWPDLWSVKVVAMDMWRPYRDLASKAFPQATLVVDKFHVLRLTNFCMDQIRKEVKGELPQADRRSLRKDRFILLRRTKELSMKEVLFKDMWLASLPDLAEAYRLKEAFYDIYDASSRALAERLYENWKESIPPGRVKTAFTPLLMACKNWHAEIFNYFDHRQTNATTEALNSLVRHAHRAGRGTASRPSAPRCCTGKESGCAGSRPGCHPSTRGGCTRPSTCSGESRRAV